MVTKWKNDSRLAYDASGVDPHLSLANLAGVFDEPSRQAALAKLQGRPVSEIANDTAPTTLTLRQQGDEIRLERERLTLARESGEVVPVKAVQARAMEAVTRLTLSLESRQHTLTDAILETTQADPKLRVTIQRLIRNNRIEALGKFAQDMQNCATIADDQPLPAFDADELTAQPA